MKLESTIEVELRCEKCNGTLQSSEQLRRDVWVITVELCDECITEAKGATK